VALKRSQPFFCRFLKRHAAAWLVSCLREGEEAYGTRYGHMGPRDGPGNHVGLRGLLGGAERIRTSDLQHDAVDVGDQLREPVAPLLERALAEVLAVEAEEVEGAPCSSRAPYKREPTAASQRPR
jgi:hypothetical protein